MTDPQKSSPLVISRTDEERGSTFREVGRSAEVTVSWSCPPERPPGVGAVILLVLTACLLALPLRWVHVSSDTSLIIMATYLFPLTLIIATWAHRARSAPARGTVQMTFAADLNLYVKNARRRRSDPIGHRSTFQRTLPRRELVGADVEGDHLCLRLDGNRSNYLAMPWQTPAEREYVAGCVNAWCRGEPLETAGVLRARVDEERDEDLVEPSEERGPHPDEEVSDTFDG